MIDTHCHLHFDRFEDDLNEVIENARNAGISTIVTIGTDLESSRQSLEIAEKYPHVVVAAAGFHPTDCLNTTEADIQELKVLLNRHPQYVAVGEIGLDLYWKEVPLDKQIWVFNHMVALAEELDKPMIIHNRDALKEMHDLFSKKTFLRESPGVMHSFAGTIEDARFYLDKGFYISFTGVVTFKNFKAQDVVKYVPVDRLLLETDAPFLAPVPYRGKRNEPAYVRNTCMKIAELKGIPAEELAETTTRNASELFKLSSFGDQK